MARFRSLAVLGLLVLLPACSEGEIERRLDDAAASARAAYDDIAATIQDLIDGLDDETRAVVEEARTTAEEARAALEAFAADPNEETRRALRDADERVEDVRRRLEAISVPDGVRGALDRVLDSLGDLRRAIGRALDQG